MPTEQGHTKLGSILPPGDQRQATLAPQQAQGEGLHCLLLFPKAVALLTHEGTMSQTGPDKDCHSKATSVPPPLWGMTR